MFRQIDDQVLVSGQIQAADIADARAAGVTMIVNNRPDGEAPGQPTSAEIAAAAKEAGIAYRHIPVRGGFPASQIDEMTDLLASSEGKVLAFCASGTRSTYLWALARARSGSEPDQIVAAAAAAGYDLTSLRPQLG